MAIIKSHANLICILMQLCESRHAYAVLKKFPKQYIKILKKVATHSDNEFSPEHNVHIIKTLGYRSNNANIFIRRLDVEMLKSNQLAGNNGRKRVCKLPGQSIASKFTKPHIGLPIDFYHHGWLKKLNEANRRLIPDTDSVAFLPDARLSLLPTPVPDKKLGDQAFSDKFRDILVEPYGLDILHGKESNTNHENEGASGNDSIKIDNEHDNKDLSEDEELFLDEGDYGDLYNHAESDIDSDHDLQM
jgi:hypothetical protein